jgi:RNA polymerase sigma factor (sigma-70 family)
MKELADVIDQCKKGSREAQKLLYYLTIDQLKITISRYCRNVFDAEDALQNTYIIIFEKIKLFDENKGNFNSWASRILINEYFQKLRRNKNKNYDLDEVKDEDYINEFNWNSFTLDEVMHVIETMKEPQQIILKLYYFDQLNYTEIASLLNQKESSVRGNLSRARKALELLWTKSTNYKNLANEYF